MNYKEAVEGYKMNIRQEMEMYAKGMRCNNPLRTGEIIPTVYGPGPEISKYLIDRRDILIQKYISRRVLRNKFIVYPLVGLSGIVGIAVGMIIPYLEYKYTGTVGFLSGFIPAGLMWITGMLTFSWLDDYFPTETMYISYKNRKR